MDIKELLKLATTAIATNKLRSFLTTLGIIIGVYALVAILSFAGISLPFISFIYRFERFALIIGGILLIVKPFVNI